MLEFFTIVLAGAILGFVFGHYSGHESAYRLGARHEKNRNELRAKGRNGFWK